VVQTRLVRRMQPGARNAVTGPNRALEWGQVNFLHTTDTHGWLAGHMKEPNYGADWGDFLSFTKGMRREAANLGVDLLIVDTGVRGNSEEDSTGKLTLTYRICILVQD
jgi:2',3'-cyclic-nucleotide 2'-phosphodiesterase (5'-nucleotidase family)